MMLEPVDITQRLVVPNGVSWTGREPQLVPEDVPAWCKLGEE